MSKVATLQKHTGASAPPKVNIKEEYVLSEGERAALLELEEQAKLAVQQAEAQSLGMLRLILRQQGLKGNWNLTQDRKKLIPAQAAPGAAPEPAPAPPTEKPN